MAQSLAHVLAHLVFSTKHRKPFLTDPEDRAELYAVMATAFKKVESPALLINGVEDHIHALFSLSRNFAIKKVVEEVKKGPSKWIKTKGSAYRGFHWQAGYGIFSVSASMVSEVKSYMAGQERRHKKISFKDEFRMLCHRHGIEIDERYVWD